MKTITQKEEQHAAACCSEPKNRYICISEESEGACTDTLFETLPGNVNIRKIEQGILDIDARYRLDIADKNQDDVDFYNAVSATTQGEVQRTTRDEYIKRYIL